MSGSGLTGLGRSGLGQSRSRKDAWVSSVEGDSLH